jgi:hypothetical protein
MVPALRLSALLLGAAAVFVTTTATAAPLAGIDR